MPTSSQVMKQEVKEQFQQDCIEIENVRTAAKQNAQTLRNIADVLENPAFDIKKLERMSGNLFLVKKSLDATIDRYRRNLERT